ncbi:hypothetical protein PhaeoP83_01650 [Phaeobacter inhibens]|uniref:Uncharacterized protein n=1 Tax=Phaeobacter inhibens TaxID=221822 RepID=A0ABN5GLM8_9RHOB|nr:hypothetical protein PhaeoP83_01650 [Phaeobacter inhibens]AUQ94479.1 hypothetical protein PhaeoP66_01697 [Phaeobacter inhibens]AUR19729.1 hypothetical protein PhaeoP80_01650 [Phaeobacter inhibens]
MIENVASTDSLLTAIVVAQMVFSIAQFMMVCLLVKLMRSLDR